MHDNLKARSFSRKKKFFFISACKSTTFFLSKSFHSYKQKSDILQPSQKEIYGGEFSQSLGHKLYLRKKHQLC